MVIYAIKNTINKHLYVGSARDFLVRKYKHLNDLRKGKHHSLYLQRAYNKYGEQGFRFVVLETVRKESQLLKREQHYLDKLNPVYNICHTAGSCLGIKLSEERKEALRKSSKCKPIIQLTLSGRKIRQWFSIAEAARKLGINESQISSCCKGYFRQAKGFKFQYKDNPIPYRGFAKQSSAKYTKEERSKIQSENFSKDFQITFPDGHKEIIHGLRKFCREQGLSFSSMYTVSCGENKSIRGYKVKRIKKRSSK